MPPIAEYLYTATCYFPYALILLLSMCLLPALAFFPSLITRPLLFTAVPIISLAIISSMALVLLQFGLYHRPIVLSITTLLSIVAVFRLYFYYRRNTVQWQHGDHALIFINFSILLPLIAMSGISAFMIDDALCSWNFWAMHYYHSQPAMILAVSYPQFFPLFISYAYKLLGHPEYQGPVKAILVIFAFTILNAITFSSKQTAKLLIPYLLLIFICVFPGSLLLHFYRFYSLGYADPLLAAALLCSCALLFYYLDHPQEKIYLWLAIISGITASMSKQPGLLWVFWVFPLIIIRKFFLDKKINLQEIATLILQLIPALIWLYQLSKIFYLLRFQNGQIFSASTGTSQQNISIFFMTFFHGFVDYFVYQPQLLLLYIFSGIATMGKSYKKILYWGFIIPCTILWLTFASYEIRNGLYLFTLCGFLIASDNYFIERFKNCYQKILFLLNFCAQKINLIAWIVLIIGFSMFIRFCYTDQKREYSYVYRDHGVEGPVFPLNGPQSNIYNYFSTGAPFIYQQLFLNPAVKLWIPTHYIYSIFYGYHSYIMPPLNNDPKLIYQNLVQTQPDYVFTGGNFHILPASQAAEQIIKQCPFLFNEIPLGNPYFQYKLYQFSHDANKQALCQQALQP